jgi:hypothetical protein
VRKLVYWIGIAVLAAPAGRRELASGRAWAEDIWEPLPGPYADPAKKTAPDFRDMLFTPNGDLYVATRNDGVFRSSDKGFRSGTGAGSLTLLRNGEILVGTTLRTVLLRSKDDGATPPDGQPLDSRNELA